MVELREQLRFALEARQALLVRGERRRQDLDRDVAPELGVGRPVDLAHAALAQLGGDLVGAEAGADHLALRPHGAFRSSSAVQSRTTTIGVSPVVRARLSTKRWPSAKTSYWRSIASRGGRRRGSPARARRGGSPGADRHRDQATARVDVEELASVRSPDAAAGRPRSRSGERRREPSRPADVDLPAARGVGDEGEPASVGREVGRRSRMPSRRRCGIASACAVEVADPEAAFPARRCARRPAAVRRASPSRGSGRARPGARAAPRRAGRSPAGRGRPPTSAGAEL